MDNIQALSEEDIKLRYITPSILETVDNSKSPEFNKKRMQKASFFISIYQNFREKLPETCSCDRKKTKPS